MKSKSTSTAKIGPSLYVTTGRRDYRAEERADILIRAQSAVYTKSLQQTEGQETKARGCKDCGKPTPWTDWDRCETCNKNYWGTILGAKS